MSSTSRRLLLIEPPFYRLYKPTYSLTKHPLALGYLSGVVLQQTDWQVQTYNADFSANAEAMKVTYLAGAGFEQYQQRLRNLSDPIWDELRRVLAEYQPTVLGLTAKTQNFAAACNVAVLARQMNPELRIILGGPHASMAAREALLSCPAIDVAVRGEGEQTLIDLLRALDAGQPLTGIPGTVARGADGELVEAGPRTAIADLDALPFPHASAPQCLRDYEQYPAEAFQYVFATRACPFACYFCGSRNVWGRQTRWRSAENVAREMAALRRLGLNHAHFDDDTFGVRPDYIEQLCTAITRHAPGMSWSCELHVKLCKEPILAAMARAGCTGVQVGVESGSNDMLKQLRKNITIEQALDACRLVKQYGMFLSTFFILGFPRETEQTLADTVQAIRQVKADRVIYSIFTPYPGTESFQDCRTLNLVDDSFDVSRFNHQSPANCFTAYIPPERFRALASRVERMVDRRNTMARLRHMATTGAARQARKLARWVLGHDGRPLATTSDGVQPAAQDQAA